MRLVAILILSLCLVLSAGGDEAVWTGAGVTLQGGPSPDGRWLSYVNSANGALAIRDLSNGEARDVATKPPGSKEFAYFSVFSPDSHSLAYAWFNEQGFYELRVVSLEPGASPVLLYRNELAGFVQPCAWTPDGRQILTLLFRQDNISQIALVPAAKGPPRVLRSLNWVYPKKMDISPDGRWLVYDNFAQEGSEDRAIFALSIDGRTETRLTTAAGNYLFPMWHPDGQKIWFVGEQGGREELWSLAVRDGHPGGEMQRTEVAAGRMLPLGITRSGKLYYGIRRGQFDVFLASPRNENRALATKFAGRNSAPALSPGGSQLAYLSRRGTENFGRDARVIVVQALGSGEERELAVPMAHLESLQWSPDETHLLVSGSDGKGRGGLFLVRVKDGDTKLFAAEAGGPSRGFAGVFSADGSTVYYLRSDDELRARQVSDGEEKVLLKGQALQYLAVSADGNTLAVGVAGNAIRITPLRGDGVARLVPFPGLTGLHFSDGFVASRKTELWEVASDGSAVKQLVKLPGLASGNFANKRIAFSSGGELAEVHAVNLP